MVWLSTSPEVIAHVSPDQDTKSQSVAGVALSVTLEPRATHASAVPDASALPNATEPFSVSEA